MNVFVRWRPLAETEVSGGNIDYSSASPNTSDLVSVCINRAAAPTDRHWKGSAAFNAVFNVGDDNAAVYSMVAEPNVANVMRGSCSSVFAYGHSGSGKTHTIIGYNQENRSGLGLSLAAARQLFDSIAKHNQTGDHQPLAVGLSLFELRGKSAFDLLNGRVECHIREGPDGRTHIRGKTETLDGGKIRVRPIMKRTCWTYESLQEELRQGLANRAVGSSTVHDKSSRAHAIMELEVINQALTEAREALIDRQSELIPVGKRATGISIEEQSKGYVLTASGGWGRNPDYEINQARIDAAEAEKAEFEARVEEAEELIANIYKSSGLEALGGKFVFIDLAGAEYQQDSGGLSLSRQMMKQTLQEKQEGRQINTDLLALKETIRAWSAKKARIPFRSSPLTMVLREHFMSAELGSSAMIVTVSPAKGQFAATLNSLKYGSLVGSAKK